MVVSLGLGKVRFEESKELLCTRTRVVSDFGRCCTWGGSESGFCGVVCGEFGSQICGCGGSFWNCWGGEGFNYSDVCIFSLFEAEGTT